MPEINAFDQFNGSSVTGTVIALPAKTTLIRARLSCYTWFSSQNTTTTFQGAPPNTLLGISYVPHGTVVPLVSPATWTNGDCYIVGPGRLLCYHRQLIEDRGQIPVFTYLQHVYS